MKGDVDAAWAAGLFEGEGSIVLQRDGRRVSLSLTMTDEDVVRRFAEIMVAGTRLVLPVDKREAHYKRAWRWQTSAHEDVLECLAMMRPWFGARRAAKADEAVDRVRWSLVHCARGHEKPAGSKGCATCNQREVCKRGHPLVGPDARVRITTRGARQCKVCANEAARIRRQALTTP